MIKTEFTSHITKILFTYKQSNLYKDKYFQSFKEMIDDYIYILCNLKRTIFAEFLIVSTCTIFIIIHQDEHLKKEA